MNEDIESVVKLCEQLCERVERQRVSLAELHAESFAQIKMIQALVISHPNIPVVQEAWRQMMSGAVADAQIAKVRMDAPDVEEQHQRISTELNLWASWLDALPVPKNERPYPPDGL